MYAPVLICTLSRYDHFKKCLESLSQCTDASKTDLYIGLDYPLNDSHYSGYQLIKKYLETVTGFNSVNVIKREVNYGVKKNFDDSIHNIFKKHEFLILSEDDNEFSVDFLKFMNYSLNFYNQRNDIFAICGYGFPIELPSSFKEQIYLWTGFSGWGAGIWKSKWNEINWNKKIINDNFKKLSLNFIKMYSISRIANFYIPSIYNEISSDKIHGDIVISIHLYENSMFCVFPVISRVRNNGHDGTGANCAVFDNDFYSQQKISSSNELLNFNNNLKKDKIIYQLLFKHFKYNKFKLIKFQLKNYYNLIFKKIF
jgi:hypothetical protein